MMKLYASLNINFQLNHSQVYNNAIFSYLKINKCKSRIKIIYIYYHCWVFLKIILFDLVYISINEVVDLPRVHPATQILAEIISDFFWVDHFWVGN